MIGYTFICKCYNNISIIYNNKQYDFSSTILCFPKANRYIKLISVSGLALDFTPRGKQASYPSIIPVHEQHGKINL